MLIVTHAKHRYHDELIYSYGPYVREMNIWGNYCSSFTIIAPKSSQVISAIDLPYAMNNINYSEVASFDFLTIKSRVQAVFRIPIIMFTLYKAMKSTDHIHLRCPGNMGLLGCIVQVFFPKKIKTAKYAGNWDSNSKQPLSYRLQKLILNNTFLTKNMTVLVYGEWPKVSKNIKSFFTATYFDKDKLAVAPKNLTNTIQFIFVGTLSIGKKPIYAIQLVEKLYKIGYNVQLNLYGEGAERHNLAQYIKNESLNSYIRLNGNQSLEVIKKAYQESHFLVLPSQSEGWPKAVAEAMFWGCVPISTPVSCVPNMLQDGARGILLQEDLDVDTNKIRLLIDDEILYQTTSNAAMTWSRLYTLDYFENEIKNILQ
ncbi:glycosyltransferase involved in cell wall biosynthesis [Flavobacterium branchiophilum]|uniref:Glycosyltransferase involved in cell wall biosynthesis n=2 Tax=Flavobacterium branchiophilum TaxID=55197 RepID=A0A543G902_9FLAO|nr:glycosyltransferase involved in cell wall biosynthesis [Flavobacterium branchiophilum]